MKATWTFLKLALPAACVLLLAGCITDPYQYRGGYGGGDYYYGRPSVEYRHHDYYGGYGDPYYGRSGWSFGIQYGYPYGYGYGRHRHGYGGYGGYGYGGYGYGGWPYYRGWPPYPPIVVRPRPGTDPGPGGDGDDQGPPTWRDLDRIRDGGVNEPIRIEPTGPRMGTGLPPRTSRPDVTRAPPPRQSVERAPRPVRESRVERIQRTVEERDER